MKLLNRARYAILLALPLVFLSSLSLRAWAVIEYSDDQRETMVEMIDQLEQRHYAKHRYDDAMSSAHLDSYIDRFHE